MSEFTRTIETINDDSYWRCLEITYKFKGDVYRDEITITTPALTPEYLDIADSLAMQLANGYGGNEFHTREPLADYLPKYELIAYMPSDETRPYATDHPHEGRVMDWIKSCMARGVTKFKIRAYDREYEWLQPR